MMSSLFIAAALAAGPQGKAGGPQIDWFQGDVQAAFDLAKKQKRPLFLYWGAVWCPPCNQIKKTIFTRREFVEKSRLFLPVYLDGDTESAQLWGEKLGASGYPTMIVYSPEGKEVLRLPTGLQLEQFNAVLDEALQRLSPIGEQLEAALAAADAAAVADSTWRLLAYYSWDQDTSLKLKPAEKEAKFRALEARVPARLRREKARLFTEWLGAAIALAGEEPEDGKPRFALGAAERETARVRVRELLADRELRLATLQVLEYAAKDIVRLLEPEAGESRAALVAAWDRAMREVEADPSLSVEERLLAVNPALELFRLDAEKGATPPPELQERVRRLVRWADENGKDGYTRQTAINTASQLLEDAGLKDEAKKLLLAELERAIAPHYFMSGLASLARDEGKKDEAVDWMKKAYETATGRATRFQWGTSYLIGLIELVPERGERIRDESLRVLKEVLAHDDAFAGRNQARMKRLAKKYVEWNEGGVHAAEIAAVRADLEPRCSALSDKVEPGADQAQRARCSEFFARLGSN